MNQQSPISKLLKSYQKPLVMSVVALGGVYLLANSDNNQNAQGSVFGKYSASIIEPSTANNRETKKSEVPKETTDNTIANGVKFQNIFPPKNFKFTNAKGEEVIHKYFQRSSTLVPRVKIDTPQKVAYVEFVLNPASETPEIKKVKKNVDNWYRTRFTNVAKGKHDLLIRAIDKEGNILQESFRPGLNFIDKSIVLLGDGFLNGEGIEAGPENLTFAQKSENGIGIENFLEHQFLTQKDEVVYIQNLLQAGQNPVNTYQNWDTNNFRNYLRSITGKASHELILGVDEIWLSYSFDFYDLNLTPHIFGIDLDLLAQELIKSSIDPAKVVIIGPTFSAEKNMKPYLGKYEEVAKKYGFQVRNDIYEATRMRYGEFVDLEKEPNLTASGMDEVATKLVKNQE